MFNHLSVEDELDGVCIDLVLVFAATEHTSNLFHVLDGFVSGHCKVRLPSFAVVSEVFVLLLDLLFQGLKLAFIELESLLEVHNVTLIHIYAIQKHLLYFNAFTFHVFISLLCES